MDSVSSRTERIGRQVFHERLARFQRTSASVAASIDSEFTPLPQAALVAKLPDIPATAGSKGESSACPTSLSGFTGVHHPAKADIQAEITTSSTPAVLQTESSIAEADTASAKVASTDDVAAHAEPEAQTSTNSALHESSSGTHVAPTEAESSTCGVGMVGTLTTHKKEELFDQGYTYFAEEVLDRLVPSPESEVGWVQHTEESVEMACFDRGIEFAVDRLAPHDEGSHFEEVKYATTTAAHMAAEAALEAAKADSPAEATAYAATSLVKSLCVEVTRGCLHSIVFSGKESRFCFGFNPSCPLPMCQKLGCANPTFNRGCRDCNIILCKSCYTTHTCMHELSSGSDDESTPLPSQEIRQDNLDLWYNDAASLCSPEASDPAGCSGRVGSVIVFAAAHK